MRNTATVALFAGALFFATAANAQNDAEDGDTATKVALSDAADEGTVERNDETIVCRNMAPKVGTRIPGREVCLPVYQWEEWERTTRETANDVETRGLIRNNP
ncbi:MAG: hypothetical protein ACKVGV_04560 [Sphingomonadales bacterium]